MEENKNRPSFYEKLYHHPSHGELTYDEAMAHFAGLSEEMKYEMEITNEDLLKRYGGDFDLAPEEVQEEILRNEAEWATEYGAQGSLAREIHQHYARDDFREVPETNPEHDVDFPDEDQVPETESPEEHQIPERDDQNLFSKHWYVFDVPKDRELTYDEAMAQLSGFFQRPNDWRLHNREQALKDFGCRFEELPAVEQEKLNREEAEWIATYGKNGSVEKEIRKYYEGREEAIHPTIAMSAIEMEQVPESTQQQHKTGWLGRLLGSKGPQGMKDNKTGKNRQPDLDPDKD